jgi:hypothetical protein
MHELLAQTVRGDVPTWIAALCSCATTGAAVLYTAYTKRLIDSERDRSSPFVSLTFDDPSGLYRAQQILLKNTGPRPAFDVRIRLEPSDINPSGAMRRHVAFQEGLPALAPGESIAIDAEISRLILEDIWNPASNGQAGSLLDSGRWFFFEVFWRDRHDSKQERSMKYPCPRSPQQDRDRVGARQ